jgi:hypothetical protein
MVEYNLKVPILPETANKISWLAFHKSAIQSAHEQGFGLLLLR